MVAYRYGTYARAHTHIHTNTHTQTNTHSHTHTNRTLWSRIDMDIGDVSLEQFLAHFKTMNLEVAVIFLRKRMAVLRMMLHRTCVAACA